MKNIFISALLAISSQAFGAYLNLQPLANQSVNGFCGAAHYSPNTSPNNTFLFGGLGVAGNASCTTDVNGFVTHVGAYNRLTFSNHARSFNFQSFQVNNATGGSLNLSVQSISNMDIWDAPGIDVVVATENFTVPANTTQTITLNGNHLKLKTAIINFSATNIAGVSFRNFSVEVLSSVGGNVSGLAAGEAVTLINNGSDNKTVSANGSFTFDTFLESGSSYSVTVGTNPPGKICSVTRGSGTVGVSNVTNVAVACAVPAPTVSSVSPTSGTTTGGTSITITGTNLTGATGITVGGAACTGVTITSATSATCSTPAGSAGTASILVTTGGGTNAANTLFTYVATPTVTAVSPTSGSTTGGTSITITGTNLTGATGITVGGSACSAFSVTNSTTATCTTPAGSAGTASVLVTTAGGTNAANTLFTYFLPIPIVSANGSATITGGNFLAAQFSSASRAPPTGKTFPYGVFEFTAQTTSGGTVSITITYPQALPTNTRYLKLINDAWADWTNLVSVSGNTVTYSVVDGGTGDSNSAVGLITDPFGPVIDVATDAAPIPTLSEWAMIFLASLMAMFAIFTTRRR